MLSGNCYFEAKFLKGHVERGGETHDFLLPMMGMKRRNKNTQGGKLHR